MKRFLMILCSGLVASQALAEPPAKPPIEKLSVSREDCGRLVDAVPEDGVAYQPGVDVHKNPVIPAEGPDGNANGIKRPNVIVIDFGLDLAGRYGIQGGSLFTAKAGLFPVHYDIATGGLTINGQPLKREDSQAVRRACKVLLKKQKNSFW